MTIDHPSASLARDGSFSTSEPTPADAGTVPPAGRAEQALRIFLTFFGLVCCGIACLHLALGPQAIPGAIAVNATVDSEDRFYAVLFLFFGGAVIWSARAMPERGAMLRFLLAVFFLSGLTRLLSLSIVGWPHPLFLWLGAMELALPIAVWSALPGARRSMAAVERTSAGQPSVVLRSLVLALGLCCCVMAIAYIALGGSAIPGGSPLNATMDSEVRFYATLLLGFGIATIWAGRDLVTRRQVFGCLMAAYACGGLARIVSWAMVGPPNALLQSRTAVELLLPVLLWGWLRRTASRR